MTVPEAGGHNQTFAVNYRGIMRDFDGCAWPNSNNAAVVYKNRAVLDCFFRGRGINFRPDQGEVRGTSEAARKKHPKQEESVKRTDSHVHNITLPATRRQSTRLASPLPDNENQVSDKRVYRELTENFDSTTLLLCFIHFVEM